MIRALLIPLLLGGQHPFAHAADLPTPRPQQAQPCDLGILAYLKQPKRIVRSDQKSKPEEVDQAGTILKHGDKFPKLKTGSYVYVYLNFTSRPDGGILVYSPRLAPEVRAMAEKGQSTPLEILATHRSIVRKLAAQQGVAVEEIERHVYAAGDFKVLAGKWISNTNQAGSFHGGRQHLEFGQAQLDLHGMPDEGPLFRITDVSNNPPRTDNHEPELRLAGWELEIVKNPEMQKLKEKLIKLVEKYYWPMRKSSVYVEDFLAELYNRQTAYVKANNIDAEEDDAMTVAFSSFGGMMTLAERDDFDLAFHNLLKLEKNPQLFLAQLTEDLEAVLAFTAIPDVGLPPKKPEAIEPTPARPPTPVRLRALEP